MTTITNNYALSDEHIARAYELERLERYDLALQEVQRALDLNPHSAEAHSCGAWVLRQSGRLDDAEQAARSALSFDPRLATAHNVLACILWSKGRPLEAERAFEAAIALQGPDAALYVTNYARMMLAWRRPQDALELADRALALAPSASIGHEVRGEALRVLGKNSEAVEALRTALRLDPLNAQAHNRLGQVQLAQSRVDEAQASFREALRLQPGERKIQANLVSALQARYPLYGPLLAFTMRANTTRGRVYFLSTSIIALTLILLLPVALGLVYGFDTRMPQHVMNVWMLLMFSVFTVWMLAIVGRLILQPFFNLLLRLDARNRAVVQSEPSDIVGTGLLFVAVLSLLTYGVLLVTAGPFQTSTLVAIDLAVAGLFAVLLSGGMRMLDRTTTIHRWASWGSYGVLAGCSYTVAVGSALDILPTMGWVVLLFITSLGTYGVLWVIRVLDAHQVPASPRRALMQWLLGIVGAAFIGFITTISLGLEIFDAVLVAVVVSSVGCLLTTHRTVRSTRLYRRWALTYGEVSAQNRAVLLFMSTCACLAAIALAFRYLPAG